MVARSKTLLIALSVVLLAVPACSTPPVAPEVAFKVSEEPATSPPEPATVVADSTPIARVIAATDCRSGPGLEYEVVTGLEEGTSYVVLEKYAQAGAEYWIIQLEPGKTCWLWKESTSVAGKVENLPEATAPATPTSPPNLAVIRVTVWGPVITSSEQQKLSGVIVELVEKQENGLFLAVGKPADEDPIEKGVYYLVDVPSGERMVQAKMEPDYVIDVVPINVVLQIEPNELEIHVDWTNQILRGCSRLEQPLQRIRCYRDQQVAPIGTGVFQSDFGLDPAATATP